MNDFKNNMDKHIRYINKLKTHLKNNWTHT